MTLHENTELFSDAIIAASRPIAEGGLGIKDIFIEKDYWITRSLKLLSQVNTSQHAVFKGGTSLSKTYGIGARFSEDIDIAILDADTLTGNQLKSLIKRTSKAMSAGLEEIIIPGITSKGSHYHKAFYRYPRVVTTNQVGAIKAGQILIEISAFGNPYPYVTRSVQSFLTDFFLQIGQNQLIEEYNMHPVDVLVLDKRRTLTEKLASLIRCSLANDAIGQMTNKIRHFYDLHYLLQDEDTRAYISTKAFYSDFTRLLYEDQQRFKQPEGWQERTIDDSVLITQLHDTWQKLQPTYMKELPDLAYREIPSSEQIENSMHTLLQCII